MALLSTCDPVTHSDQDEFQVRGRKQNQAQVPVSCGAVSDVLLTATLSSSTAAQLGSSLRHGSPDLAEPLSLVLNWIESVDSSSPILERDHARRFFLERPATPRGRSSTSKLDSQCYSKVAQDCSDISSIMPDSQSYSQPAKACAAISIQCLNGGLACQDLNTLPVHPAAEEIDPGEGRMRLAYATGDDPEEINKLHKREQLATLLSASQRFDDLKKEPESTRHEGIAYVQEGLAAGTIRDIDDIENARPTKVITDNTASHFVTDPLMDSLNSIRPRSSHTGNASSPVIWDMGFGKHGHPRIAEDRNVDEHPGAGVKPLGLSCQECGAA